MSANSQPVIRRGRLRAHLSAPLFRNAYLLILSSTVTSALGLPYWALAAHHYAAANVGKSSAVISAVSLISGIAQLGMAGILPRYLPGAGRRSLRLVLTAYGAAVLFSLLVGIVAALTSRLWSPALRFLGSDVRWLVFFVAINTASTISGLQDSVMTGLRQARWVPVENTIFAVAKLGLVVAFATSHPQAGIVLAWMAPLVALLIPVNLAIFIRFIPHHVRMTAHAPRTWTGADLRRLVFGNFTGDVFSLIVAFFMPILVVDLAGARAAAYFYVPWTVTLALRFVAQNLTTSMTVETAFDERRLGEHLKKTAIGIYRLLVPAVLVTLIAGRYVLSVFGHEYAQLGTATLRLLAVGTLAHAVSMLGLGVARLEHRGRIVAFILGTDATIMLVLSTVLVPSMGITGAGLGWLVAQLVAATMSSAVLWRGLRRAARLPAPSASAIAAIDRHTRLP